MSHRTQEQDMGGDDDVIQPLEFSGHTVWAEAHGLPELLRRSHPAEIEANRAEWVEAANLILSAFGVKQ